MHIIFVYLMLFTFRNVAEKFQYFSTEHPKLIYNNPKYFSYGNLTSRRYGRNDPLYYVGIHFTSLYAMADNVTLDFYFYEWLTNVYKRSFVEMHFTLCDLVHNNHFFGAALRQGKLTRPCPFPAGEYNLYNMTVPIQNIPPHFPFRKGRIYCNVSAIDAGELMTTAYIDMELKNYNTNNKKKH